MCDCSQLFSSHRTVFYFARDLVQVILAAKDHQVSWSERSTTINDGILFRDDFLHTDASMIATDINDHLSAVPPYRFTSYASDQKIFLVLSIQHSLFDGISLPVLLSNAEQAYLEPALPPSPSASSVLDCIASIDMNKAREHWTSMFVGYDWRKMMFRETTESTAATLSVPFKTTLSALQQKASQQKTTVQALLTASYGYLAATSMYAEDDIVFGVNFSFYYQLIAVLMIGLGYSFWPSFTCGRHRDRTISSSLRHSYAGELYTIRDYP